jgi:endonuclease/exonuclease/phosphatase family metal-dependent hydrolase
MDLKQDMQIRLLTYNIQGLPWISIDIDAIIEWLFSSSKADIICLQEVWSAVHRLRLARAAYRRGWLVYYPDDPLPFRWDCMISGSGLCILIKPHFIHARPSFFTSFEVAHGADALVTKGFFEICLLLSGRQIHIVNTHMQSDITGLPCCRLNFDSARAQQEWQIYRALRDRPGLQLIVGDMNTPESLYFHRVDTEKHVTFPSTGESLDHLLCLSEQQQEFQHIRTEFFDDIRFSDHIPVAFDIRV